MKRIQARRNYGEDLIFGEISREIHAMVMVCRRHPEVFLNERLA